MMSDFPKTVCRRKQVMIIRIAASRCVEKSEIDFHFSYFKIKLVGCSALICALAACV